MGSLNRSEVIEEHFYCKVDSLQANEIYDSIDRSDEDFENTLTVNYTRTPTLQTALLRLATPGSRVTSTSTQQGGRVRIAMI